MIPELSLSITDMIPKTNTPACCRIWGSRPPHPLVSGFSEPVRAGVDPSPSLLTWCQEATLAPAPGVPPSSPHKPALDSTPELPGGFGAQWGGAGSGPAGAASGLRLLGPRRVYLTQHLAGITGSPLALGLGFPVSSLKLFGLPLAPDSFPTVTSLYPPE